MVTEIKETIEDVRNRLITECRREQESERAGYVNGVLDMYNEAKRLEKDREAENERHRPVK